MLFAGAKSKEQADRQEQTEGQVDKQAERQTYRQRGRKTAARLLIKRSSDFRAVHRLRNFFGTCRCVAAFTAAKTSLLSEREREQEWDR